jgi:hypothetical protein
LSCVALQRRFDGLKRSLTELQDAVLSVLRTVDPKVPRDADPGTFLSRLRDAPSLLKAWARRAAVAGGQGVLVLVRSHFPRVDIQRLGGGLAKDTDDAKRDALVAETLPLARSLAEKVRI